MGDSWVLVRSISKPVNSEICCQQSLNSMYMGHVLCAAYPMRYFNANCFQPRCKPLPVFSVSCHTLFALRTTPTPRNTSRTTPNESTRGHPFPPPLLVNNIANQQHRSCSAFSFGVTRATYGKRATPTVPRYASPRACTRTSREICFGSFLRANAASRALGGWPTAGAERRGCGGGGRSGGRSGVAGLRAQDVVATGQINVRPPRRIANSQQPIAQFTRILRPACRNRGGCC